ncbi:MAG: glycosyltransferase [bacterium]|nr:glycosyltransferase [bacterium]
MKVSLVSPAPPFHGGIVTSAAFVVKHLLSRGHDVQWVSLKKQYPKIIFPGTSQTSDVAQWMHMPNEPVIVPWLPWTWFSAAKLIKKNRPDAVYIKYWLPYFAPAFGTIARLCKRAGLPVYFILDNVIAHEKYPFAKQLTRYALSSGDGFIAQSDQVRSDLLNEVPSVDPGSVITVPLPVFDFGIPGRERKTKSLARVELGIPDTCKVVLFFGFIKAYKGLEYLIDAAPMLQDKFGKDIKVLIVGDIYGDKKPYLDRIADSSASDILQLVDGYLPDEIVEDYFVASDIVALPYVSATQSGIVQIAMNYDLPVVSTTVGGLPEVVDHGRTGFLVPPKNSEALGEAVIKFFDDNLAEEFGSAVAVEKEKYSWSRMCEAIEKLASEDE